MIWESRILRMAEGDDSTAGAGYNLEEVLQAQGRLIEQRMQENKLAMQRKEILMEQVEVMKLQITMSEDRINQLKRINEQISENYDDEVKRELLLEQRTKVYDQISKQLGELDKKTKESFETTMQGFTDQIDNLEAQLGSITDQTEDADKKRKEIQEQIAEQYAKQAEEGEKFVGKLKDAKKTGVAIDGAVSKLSRSLGVSSKFSDTMAGNFVELYAEIEGGQDGLKSLAQKLFNKSLYDMAIGALGNIVDKIIELGVGLDEASKKFEKSFGFVDNYNSQILGIYESTSLAGLSMEQSSAALGGLVNNFSAFNPNAEAANVNLAKNVALMNEFGVSTETSTKMLDNFVRAEGMTAEAATNMALDISYAGNSIGISAAKMSADFNATYGTLSQFGDDAKEIFLDLQAQAKATGVAIGDLVKVAQKFDTFSDAATTVAQLNTVLGTNLSAMELMNADYDDRLNLLREGMMLDGQAFESLDRYTKLYVQNALGVSSAAEAQKLLNMNTAEYAGYKADMEAAQMSQDELNEALIAAVPIATKLTNAITQLALVFSPIIEIIAGVLNGISQLDAMANGYLIPTIYAIGIAVGVMKIELTGAALAAANLVLPIIAVVAAFKILQKLAEFMNDGPLGETGKLLLFLAVGATAFAIASQMAGAKLQLFAMIAVGLLAIFGTEINPLFIQFPFFLAAGMLALAIASKIGGIQLIFLALAFALLFGAVALVVYAFNDLVQSMTAMFILFIENFDKLFLVGAAVYYLAGAFAAMGLAAALSLASTTMLLAAMTGLGAVLIGLTMVSGALTLDALAKSIKDIGDGMDKFANGLVKIKSVAAELSNLAGSSFLAFSMEGGKTSAIIAHESTFSAIKSGQISVDVKIPEIKVPKPVVNVYIDGKEIKKTVETIFVRNM